MSEPRAVVAIDRRDWKTLERFGIEVRKWTA